MKEVFCWNTEFNNIKEHIKNKCVSYADIAYLTEHRDEVKLSGDLELMQWAGVPEEEV